METETTFQQLVLQLVVQSFSFGSCDFLQPSILNPGPLKSIMNCGYVAAPEHSQTDTPNAQRIGHSPAPPLIVHPQGAAPHLMGRKAFACMFLKKWNPTQAKNVLARPQGIRRCSIASHPVQVLCRNFVCLTAIASNLHHTYSSVLQVQRASSQSSVYASPAFLAGIEREQSEA